MNQKKKKKKKKEEKMKKGRQSDEKGTIAPLQTRKIY